MPSPRPVLPFLPCPPSQPPGHPEDSKPWTQPDGRVLRLVSLLLPPLSPRPRPHPHRAGIPRAQERPKTSGKSHVWQTYAAWYLLGCWAGSHGCLPVFPSSTADARAERLPTTLPFSSWPLVGLCPSRMPRGAGGLEGGWRLAPLLRCPSALPQQQVFAPRRLLVPAAQVALARCGSSPRTQHAELSVKYGPGRWHLLPSVRIPAPESRFSRLRAPSRVPFEHPFSIEPQVPALRAPPGNFQVLAIPTFPISKGDSFFLRLLPLSYLSVPFLPAQLSSIWEIVSLYLPAEIMAWVSASDQIRLIWKVM